MILIAPDKFKGTLSARQAATAIAVALKDLEYIKAPMADGGEGTAEIMCASPRWERHDTYYVDNNTRTAVIDSSAIIGLKGIDASKHDILRASSLPLGVKVREILKGGCDRVLIGIGGTSTCDGGVGFLEGLGIEQLKQYRHKIIGLSDVSVPLVAEIGKPSALMFAAQKGASETDIRILHHRLESLYKEYPGHRSPYDGAGGGLGFAIASVIGAECVSGARYVLDHYDIDWSKITLTITGEGKIDEQTATGKVVDVVTRTSLAHGVPVVSFGGIVEPALKSPSVISTADYMPELPLDTTTAALRLQAAVSDYFARH